MQDTITTIYCLCDDLLKALNHTDDRQTRFSAAEVMSVPLEVMSVPLVACACFGGNMARTRAFLHGHGYLKVHLSASRFSRRLAALPAELWHTLFQLLSEVFKQHNPDGAYVVDSYVVDSYVVDSYVVDSFPLPRGHPRSATISVSNAANFSPKRIRRRFAVTAPAKRATFSVSRCNCSSPGKANLSNLS